MREDVAKDVIGMDGSGDLAEVVQRLARVHRHKVPWNAIAQSVAHRLKCGRGCSKRFEMTEVGDDELMSLVVGTMTFEQGLAQVVKACAC